MGNAAKNKKEKSAEVPPQDTGTDNGNGAQNSDNAPAATGSGDGTNGDRRRVGARPGVPRPPVRPLEQRLAEKQKAIDFHMEKIEVLKSEMKDMQDRAAGKPVTRAVKVDALDDDGLAALEKRIADEKAKRAAAAAAAQSGESNSDSGESENDADNPDNSSDNKDNDWD